MHEAREHQETHHVGRTGEAGTTRANAIRVLLWMTLLLLYSFVMTYLLAPTG